MIIVSIIMSALVLLSLTATIRLAIESEIFFSQNETLNKISSPYWCFSQIVLSPNLYELANGWSSPIPWEAYEIASQQHGLFDGIMIFFSTITVDLWFLWIPGQLVLNRIEDPSKTVIYAIRSMNILAGILLITQNSFTHGLTNT